LLTTSLSLAFDSTEIDTIRIPVVPPHPLPGAAFGGKYCTFLERKSSDFVVHYSRVGPQWNVGRLAFRYSPAGEESPRTTQNLSRGAVCERCFSPTVRSISERKLKANRENSKKSTGPRTVRGKAYSRSNAVKHGFFARDLFPLLQLDTESQQEFEALWERLREEYQPVGYKEEWEVDRITICKWKLGRAWRYENAEINRGILDTHYKELQNYGKYLKSRQKAELKLESQITADFEVLLNEAESGIDAGNGIPADFKTRLAAALADFPNRSLCEHFAQHQLAKHPELLDLWPQDPESLIAYLTARSVKTFLNFPDLVPFRESLKVSCDQQAIPNRESVDKLIRYEAATERSLARALDRLERLQRRRLAKAMPPRLDASVSSS
jgi:hypothetical protein